MVDQRIRKVHNSIVRIILFFYGIKYDDITGNYKACGNYMNRFKYFIFYILII